MRRRGGALLPPPRQQPAAPRKVCFAPVCSHAAAAAADTACLNAPKVALVSTLASVSPAQPFVFRNYELPPGSSDLFQQVCAGWGGGAAPTPRSRLVTTPCLGTADLRAKRQLQARGLASSPRVFCGDVLP